MKECHTHNEKGKEKLAEGIERLNQGRIRTLKAKENYKYWGILEANIIKQADTKVKKVFFYQVTFVTRALIINQTLCLK